MIYFDVSKEWVILIPPDMLRVKKIAEDLSHYMDMLRCHSGVSQKSPPIRDSSLGSSETPVPLILLHAEKESREKNGFSWHIGKERIEIYGESDRGLCNGVFDFLMALGFSWPDLEQEVCPPANKTKPQEYILRDAHAYHSSGSDTIRRRLLFDRREPSKTWESVISWAVRNKIDILVFSLQSRILESTRLSKHRPAKKPFLFSPFLRIFQDHYSPEEPLKLAEDYAMTIELGGWDLSFLVPRRYFLLHQGIFRMNSGKRDKYYNFCPTAPDTIRLLKGEAEKLFRSYPNIAVYHLWPDRGHEKVWCSCPACRAFTLEEQYCIAVNAVADTLADINPQGRISYCENLSRKEGIALRSNLFRVTTLPGEPGAEAGGWFLSKG